MATEAQDSPAPSQQEQEELAKQAMEKFRKERIRIGQQVIERFLNKHKDQLAKISYRHKVPEGAVQMVASLTINGNSKAQVKEYLMQSEFPMRMADWFGPEKGLDMAGRTINRSDQLVDDIVAISSPGKPRNKRRRP